MPAPIFNPRDISEHDVSFSFARSGGPGGQNVNKLNTKAALSFDLMRCEKLSWEEKNRIMRHPDVQSKMDKDGNIRITAQDSRSQEQNKSAALERLHRLLEEALLPEKERKETKIPRAQKRKRREEKRHLSEKKKARGFRGSEE